MKILWQGKTPRGGIVQWVIFGALALVVGLVAFVLVAFGLVVGALLVGFFSVATALASRRRRRGVSVYAERTASDGHEAKGDYVELDKDAYTVRVMDENKDRNA